MWDGDPKAWNKNEPSPLDQEKIKATEAAIAKDKADAAAAHDAVQKAKEKAAPAAPKVPVTKVVTDKEKADAWIAKAKDEGRWPPVDVPDFVQPYVDVLDGKVVEKAKVPVAVVHVETAKEKTDREKAEQDKAKAAAQANKKK